MIECFVVNFAFEGGAFIILLLCMHFFVACFQGECMCSGQRVAQLHMFRRSLCVHVLSLALLSILCSHLGCVESLLISLEAETFPSQFGICDVSHASDFDILTFMRHLFTWI